MAVISRSPTKTARCGQSSTARSTTILGCGPTCWRVVTRCARERTPRSWFISTRTTATRSSMRWRSGLTTTYALPGEAGHSLPRERPPRSGGDQCDASASAKRRVGCPRAQLRECAASFSTATSSHVAQPWRFVVSWSYFVRYLRRHVGPAWRCRRGDERDDDPSRAR